MFLYPIIMFQPINNSCVLSISVFIYQNHFGSFPQLRKRIASGTFSSLKVPPVNCPQDYSHQLTANVPVPISNLSFPYFYHAQSSVDVAFSQSCPLKSQPSYFHTHACVHTHTCEIFYLVNATHTLFIILLLNGIVKLAVIQKLHVDVWIKHIYIYI